MFKLFILALPIVGVFSAPSINNYSDVTKEKLSDNLLIQDEKIQNEDFSKLTENTLQQIAALYQNATVVLNRTLDAIKSENVTDSQETNSIKYQLQNEPNDTNTTENSLTTEAPPNFILLNTLLQISTKPPENNETTVQNTTEKVKHVKRDDDDAQNTIKKTDVETIIGQNKTGQDVFNAAEQEDEEGREEEANFLGGIISGFLGSLSRPDGSVDVDSLVGIIGGLSAQKEDGTYDFTGLSETLMSFFGGGDEEDGGGSNVGAFLGGLIGAIVQGSASPAGPVGAGRFSGNIVAKLLPALSGPVPAPEGSDANPQKGLDIGGFLSGFLGSASAGKGGDNAAAGNNPKPTHPLTEIKNSLFKSVFTLFSSSSASSSSPSAKSPASLRKQ